jgi:Flp pilus assembly pilin Flp
MTVDLNLSAFMAGAVLYMIYGGIYYSILLGKKDQDGAGPVKYVVAVLVAFISSALVGFLVQATNSGGLASGALIGGLIGILISIVFTKNALFGLMSKRMFLIAIGDHLIVFTLLGALHGWLL